MSYLNNLRLHFAGQFQANVSTVNNDPGHFNNATFLPSYQDMQGPHMNPPNGWFNPQGDAGYKLLGCVVTSAWLPSGAVTSTDPILHCIVADSDSHVCAKLCDLDSEQQLVSEIWGLQVRIADQHGNTLFRGEFKPAAFMDIWDRAIGASSGGDVDAGATYQSVLTNLHWEDVSHSAFLTALKAAANDGILSIKFNVDGINLDFTSPNFMCGRIVGTIGPATAAEPSHMVLGRQFMAIASAPANFFFPAGKINYFPAVVDTSASCIFLDLGNALSTTVPGGPITDLGELTLGVYNPIITPDTPAGTLIPLATIPSQGAHGYANNQKWYSQTAGIVVIPLNATQLKIISNLPLALYQTHNVNVIINESPDGRFIRADQYVYRASPGDTLHISAYATQWGNPLANATVTFVPDASQLQPSNSIDPNDVPPVAIPLEALGIINTQTTNNNGIATLSLSVTNPGTPRYFNNGQDYGLDGQVYGIRPTLSHSNGPVNQWNFVSILLWSEFTTGSPITWNDLQPIFQQYANLYPVMNRFLNLADYDSVATHAYLLKLAFGLNPDNPNSMPVTRDLSPAKRHAILQWLDNPIRGAITPVKARATAQATATTLDASVTTAMLKGGKAAAAARRLLHRSQ